MGFFVLFESATGFALFEPKEFEDITVLTDKVRTSLNDFGRLSKIIKLRAFRPFTTTEMALENQNDISEGALNDFLLEFLEQNIPSSKKAPHTLGVAEGGLQAAISESSLGVHCIKDSTVIEILRAIRAHFTTFIEPLVGALAKDHQYLFKAQRGLAHSYSRAKMKFNVNKSDNMIIQSISTLDQLDKDINTFAMRVREWYSWHFPELVKIVNDNIVYARIAKLIANRSQFMNVEDNVSTLSKITGDENQSKLILSASKTSMGYDISEADMKLISRFASRVVSLAEFRSGLAAYLKVKMAYVAPNLCALIGETVGARLINHAGSLTTLAKYPASTIQILGAEKALFRALKTRSNTPKYGLIFNSSYIGRAKTKDKGRISRYLANKCSIASRIDAFSDKPSNQFGISLAQQMEDRLKFYELGVVPAKNIDVMRDVLKTLEGMPVEQESIPEQVKKEKEEKKDKGEKKDKREQKKHKKERKEKKGDSDEEKEVKREKVKREKSVGSSEMDQEVKTEKKKRRKSSVM
eukprot:TRINITY_DN10811_c0_g1_i4.p1 TRINITY_DN10811_c0_g1~~TRINITY_DN10811_c0_g1_i4.p1  ORF type:complete len:524 (-),score=122.49 TRINITY_DN10811_c0_g1_i4:117-1688(-)